VLSKPQLA